MELEPPQRIHLVYAWNDSPNCGWPIHHKEWILISTRDHHRSPQRHLSINCGKVQRINLGYAWNVSPNGDIHKITKIPRLHCKLPPNHSLTLSHPACIVCIIGVRERGIAPFLASVTDNGFKSVCQMTWIYSITQPHTEVYRIHPHPHHTPLVNSLQHIHARN